MDWIRKIASTALLLSVLLIVNSCSIKVGLAPISSIDYSKVKTVSIADFQNRAEYVYAPLATEFNQGLKDLFRLPVITNITKRWMPVGILQK